MYILKSYNRSQYYYSGRPQKKTKSSITRAMDLTKNIENHKIRTSFASI